MQPFVDDVDFSLHVGDALDVLQTLPDESVHCVVTSPPYWGLRDYGTGVWEGGDANCDHVPADERTAPKAQAAASGIRGGEHLKQACGCRCGARRVDSQLGLEPTPEQYVENMVAVFREVRRVLRRDGTCWLNIGDSYNAYNGGAGPSSKLSKRQSRERPELESGYGLRYKGLKPKDLVGIPWRLAFALQADGWYLRSDIIEEVELYCPCGCGYVMEERIWRHGQDREVVWKKPNPMPESVTDRPTKSHEYLFLLTRSPRYYFDQDAIREPAEWARWGDQTNDKHEGSGSAAGWIKSKTKAELRSYDRYPGRGDLDTLDAAPGAHTPGWRNRPNLGRNKRSVWEIATEPYPDAHFATFPQALVEPCVLAGTSERGCCPQCGAPWERETERQVNPEGIFGRGAGRHVHDFDSTLKGRHLDVPTPQTTGWRQTCGCGVYRVEDFGGEIYQPAAIPCTVLDPFLGSGTTALVARRLGRRCVGIELSPEYAALAARRTQQLSVFA